MTEHLVHNEQTKLTASLLNGVAVVSLAVALIQNFFVAATDPTKYGGTLAIFAVFLMTGVVFHMIARQILSALREKEQKV
jgi:multisubunit Na+/H+ antiporter MnhG subunit